MKQQSAASIKGWKKHIVQQQLPRKGTEIRRTYDLFCANKGMPVKISFSQNNKASENSMWYSRLESLRNFYGLDIIRIGKGEWCLVGEWFGKVYIDYVAEKVNK